MDIQAVYLAWSGYNVVLFFFLLLLFSLQSFLVFFSFLIHIVPLSWLIYSLVNATKFLKRGDAWGLTMDATLHYSISRAAFFVLGTTFYGRMLSGIMAEIPGESASFFDARFMFYALLVCSSAEEFLFRLYTKMWDKLTKRQSGASGRVIN